MADNVKWKKTAKRWITFFLPFVLIVLVLGAYIIFYKFFEGRLNEAGQSFDDFLLYALSAVDDITAVSESEISAHDGDGSFTVEKTGEAQTARDNIFSAADSAETYISETTGHRCVRYDYMWYGSECVIIYDADSAELHDNGSYDCGVISYSIIAARTDSISY